MPDVAVTELRTRIANLQSELDALTSQLAASRTSGPISESREGGQRTVRGWPPDVRDEIPAGADHERGLRAVRDLLWQGRWGLAYHLTRALEAQSIPTDFPSSTIRAWALASQIDRRRHAEALELVQLLSRDEGAGDEILPQRLLEWATLIGLLRGVDPPQVREVAARFETPDGLPSTARWWAAYVDVLASAPRPAAAWRQLPDKAPATSEVEELLLRGETEPMRLAASCLMMAIRSAMRHIHLVSSLHERFLLNAELEREGIVPFNDAGIPVASPEALESAVCDLAEKGTSGRTLSIAEWRAKDSRTSATTGDAVSAGTQSAAERTGHPEADASVAAAPRTLVCAALDSDLSAPSSNAANTMSSLQERRHAAARERLERYAERVATRRPEPVTTGPFLSMTVQPVETGPSRADDSRDAPRLLAFSAIPTEERTLEENDSRPRPRDLPQIHAAALATAFGTDDAWNGQRSMSPASRPDERNSLWNLFFNPQAAIVAGLLVIAGAVAAGMGTGLSGRSAAETAPIDDGSTDQESAMEFTGDFSAMP